MSNAMQPPYYAVIFTSELTDDVADYGAMADRMVELARQQPGFLGIESARAGLGITVSYWRDLASIAAWKADAEHRIAQRLGRERFYRYFRLRVARVEQDSGFTRDPAG